ncbi:MaoC family dehydratase [Streptomyces sp. 2A115]|uniref:MaoC family dehydratase n=1 Tax=Streptomyces sp. 2A115 TaxID=3457439 RepID=UPI003FD2744A
MDDTTETMHTQALTSSPALVPLLARGALLSPFKRPRTGVTASRTRLVLPDVRIDLAKLAAYERACGFGVGADELPLTYPHVLGFPLAMRLMSGRAFPLPLLGLVHTSIEVSRHKALAATGEYELSVYVDELVPHRRGTEAAVVTEARAGGELVWESRSTYLARHRTTPESTLRHGTTTETSLRHGTTTETSLRHGTAPESTLEQRPVDERKPLRVLAEWRLAGDVGRRYGAASGDRNPIHLHPLAARLFGFPGTIAHGMWSVARCLAEHGAPQAALVRAEFRAPVLLPGTVAYGAEGGAFELRGDSGRLHLAGEVSPLL